MRLRNAPSAHSYGVPRVSAAKETRLVYDAYRTEAELCAGPRIVRERNVLPVCGYCRVARYVTMYTLPRLIIHIQLFKPYNHLYLYNIQYIYSFYTSSIKPLTYHYK